MRARSGGELARKDAGGGPAPSLAEVVGVSGGLSEDAVLWIAAGLAGALAVLHRAGRAHGDVRTGNVLLTRSGPQLTRDVPRRGGGASLPAADMVALGMLLVAAYTGVSNRRPDLDYLPVRLRQVVAVCLTEDPEQRATPDQLLALLRTLEPEEPVWTVEVDDLITPADTAPPSDTPVETPARTEPHGLSGPRLVLVVVAAVLVGVVVTVLLLVPGHDGGVRTADAPVKSRPTLFQPTDNDTPRQRTAPQPATPTSQEPPAPTPQRTRQTGTIDDCSGKPLTEPVSLLLFCGDGAAMLHDLVWTDWGGATATAQGVISEVACQPSCVDGREVTSAATVVVSGLADGRYTLMEIRAPQSPTDPDAHYTLDRLGPTYRG